MRCLAERAAVLSTECEQWGNFRQLLSELGGQLLPLPKTPEAASIPRPEEASCPSAMLLGPTSCPTPETPVVAPPAIGEYTDAPVGHFRY